MARNALWADDVSWLLRLAGSRENTVKMPHCVAFGCSKQAKNRKDTSISFHIFPKDDRLRRAWIQAVGRTSLPKNPRLCSEHFDADCFEDTVRLQTELLGSCPWKRKLKPEAIPTIFPHKPARSARFSSSRRAEKRKRQEVCKQLCNIFLSGIRLQFFVLTCLCIVTVVKLISVVLLYLDTRCHFAEQSRSIKSAE